VKNRIIRLGVTYNRTFYFEDNGVQRRIAYEMGKAFEGALNKTLKTGNRKIHVVFVPLPRDLLGAALLSGKVDAAVAQVTVRPELETQVDFSNPTRSNVSEVVVTGPAGPKIQTADDLSRQEVYARKNSKYYASLAALNTRLVAAGKAPVSIQVTSENLEDDDLLEMVNAGLLPAMVVDDYLAALWKKVFTKITVHDTVKLRTGAHLAVAIRKNTPKLKAALNAFLSKYGLGTAMGNTIEKRYLVSTTYVKNAASDTERKKYQAMVDLFKTYSTQYDLDFLLMAAQGYQESQLDQNAKSPVGAIGAMRVMPATGKELNVGAITKLEPNIHAGVKYIRFMVDKYYKDEPMTKLDKGLFTFASYNAGPGKIRQLRKEAAKRGLDPNVRFGNVEQIASERIGRETVTYVSNIYKYDIAYALIADQQARRDAARAAVKAGVKSP